MMVSVNLMYRTCMITGPVKKLITNKLRERRLLANGTITVMIKPLATTSSWAPLQATALMSGIWKLIPSSSVKKSTGMRIGQVTIATNTVITITTQTIMIRTNNTWIP